MYDLPTHRLCECVLEAQSIVLAFTVSVCSANERIYLRLPALLEWLYTYQHYIYHRSRDLAH